ncbi:MAG: metallophosphoesterase [Oscillospiraceae bacterium]|nr:metallophosphoesterase [Oscillospiraceae bacterium]
MKLIIFSDSHRELGHMRDVIEREKPDYVFHLGDHDADAQQIGREFPTLPVAMVRGNCDGWSDTAEILTLTLGGLRFFLCHGHTLGVKSGCLRAVYAAREQNADVLLFGHTHAPYQLCEDREGQKRLFILNPGSCGYDYSPGYGFFILENGTVADWGLRRC